MSKELEIERQKAAQLVAFVLGMEERGQFKKIPPNANSDEIYAIRNENVAKAMQKLTREAKEYKLVFTGDIDSWTKEDALAKNGLPTMAKTSGKRLGKTLAKGMIRGMQRNDIGQNLISALKNEYEQ